MQKTKLKTFSVTKVFITVTCIIAGTSLAMAGLFFSFRPPALLDVQATIAYKEIQGQKTELPNFTMQTDGLIKAKTIDKSYSSDQPINLAIDSTQSIGLSGNVILEREDSYARLIAIDDQGNEYLVYEASYPQTGSFSFNQVCEETCALDSTNIVSFKIKVLNAFLQIDQVLRLPQEGQLKSQVAAKGITAFRADLKNSQVAQRIEEINEYNQANRKYWVAGETSVSHLSYSEKKGLFRGDKLPALKGFEYYTGGYFDLSVPSVDNSELSSTSGRDGETAFKFDWRNRHGQDWLTSVKDQGSCGSCWAFSSLGATEAVTNLFYNQHIDLDLAEQDLVSCSGAGDCTSGYTPDALDYIKQQGVVDEECFPYLEENGLCEERCSDWSSRTWRIFDSEEINNSTYDIKTELTKNGPMAFDYNEWHHSMVLVGFGEITPGQYFLPHVQYIPEDDPLVGKTYWVLKNSWGDNFGDDGTGYGKFILDEDTIRNSTNPLSVLFPVIPPAGQGLTILCTDEDNDGYCWWGINPQKPASAGCPTTCLNNDEPDCNDSDDSIQICPDDFICGNHPFVQSGEFSEFGDYYSYGLERCCGDNLGEYSIQSMCCDNPSDVIGLSEGYSYFDQFGSEGYGDGEFLRSEDIAIEGNKIFVSDYNNHRVQIFEIQADGSVNFIGKFGSYGTANGQFKRPMGIAVINNRIFVVDSLNNRIQVFWIDQNNNVSFLSKFGTSGSEDGQFNNPKGIAVEGNYVYVTDSDNKRIQILEINTSNNLMFRSRFGGIAEFLNPHDLYVDDSILYVADSEHWRVRIIRVNPDFSVEYLSDFNVYYPYGIEYLEDKLYVSDHFENDIKIFEVLPDYSVNFLDTFGVGGNGNGQFNNPHGLEIKDNKIFVADYMNHRVQVFEYISEPACSEPLYCSDDTLYGQCSENKPLFCHDGELINNCQECGCPTSQGVCQSNGTCKKAKPSQPIELP